MLFRATVKIVLLFFVALTPMVARAQQTGATVRGVVADPESAVIPGATVTFTPASGKALITQSQSDGTYVLRGVPAWTYAVTVTMAGFASYVKQGVRVAAGQALTLDMQMAIQQQQQEVNVTAQAAQVSVDADSNASATVLKGKDLDALSDDPDELSSELTALAGPAAGPNGGQIYVDGFSGGQLPPKSSIREIRINQNPFSAEFDKLGYGRIEIFTKPGNDHFHGQLSFMNSNAVLNARNPFASAMPDYNTDMVSGNFGGPISKKSSFQINYERRDIGDQDIINAFVLNNSFDPIALSQTLANPKVRTHTGIRMDFQIGANDTLVARYQFLDQSEQNAGIGQLSLPTQAYSSHSDSHTFQLTETHVFTPKIINETRFQFIRSDSSQNALDQSPSLNVIGAFSGGGNPLGTDTNTQNRFELQNNTSVTAGKHTLRFGGRLRESGEDTTSTQGFNGTFTFASLDAYRITLQGLASGLTPRQIRAAGGGASQYTVSSGT